MFSVCANPNCRVAFDYRQGRFFRFHKDHVADEDAPNLHSVQHFWLFSGCCLEFTLEYQDGAGVLIKDLLMSSLKRSSRDSSPPLKKSPTISFAR